MNNPAECPVAPISKLVLFLFLLSAPSIAWGHGFDLSFNSSFNGVSIASEESNLDSGGTMANLNTLFYSPLSSNTANSLSGNSYYSVIHGFSDLVAGSNGIPGPSNLTVTFNIISPLYFSDGSAGCTAAGATAASAGTTIEMYDRDYPGGSTQPGTSPGYIDISGSTPFAAGFQASTDDPHEIAKELFLAAGSTQTYGEYGFAYDITLTLSNGITIVTPPLVDVFAMSDPIRGDFADNAPYTAAVGLPQQDAATLSIFNAATSAGNGVIGKTQSWNGSADAVWTNPSNWGNDTVPGSTTGTGSNDTVVFYSAPTRSVPTIDPGRNVQTILFELNAGSLTLGSTSGNALLLTDGGSIQVTSTVVNPQTINAPLVLEGASALYTFNTDSLTTSATLSFGGNIRGGTAGNTVLMLGGDNAGNNTIAGTIVDGSATSLALLESGPCNWILSGPNTYSGGTTVNQGTLTVASSGMLGASTGPLTITTVASLVSATVNINGNQAVGNLSGTINGFANSAVLDIAAGSSLRVNQTASTTFGATLTVADGTPSDFGAFTMQGSAAGMLEIDAPPTLGDQTAIRVNGGTLRFNLSSGPGTIGSGVTVTVASPATLQLAGSYSALSGGGTANIVNNGSTASGGGLLVTGTNQVVGIVTGTSSISGVTTYSGDTTVGDGNSAANLTATQILQNSLTINANSTVTILPSGTGGAGVAPATSAMLLADTSADSSTPPNADSDSQVVATIQSAVVAGAITAATGQRLENRIAAIEQLAANDPGADLSPLEDRVLAALAANEYANDGSTALATDITAGTFAEGLSNPASAADGIPGIINLTPSATASPTAVPEPSALLLAVLGCLAFLLWRTDANLPLRTREAQ